MTAAIPVRAGWRVVPFRDLAQSITERVDDPAASGLDHYVGLEHLDPDTLKISRWGAPSDVEATKLRFYPGDVIYARRRAYQRKLGVAKWDGIASAHALVLRARPEVCLPGFLPYFLQGDQFHRRALEISVGSLSPTINWTTLAAEEFLLPPIPEQREIVAVGTAFDSYLELVGAATARAEALLESLMQPLAAAPDSVPLTRLAELQLGRQRSPAYEMGIRPRPYLRAANLRLDEVDLFDVKQMDFTAAEEELYRVRPGDVLLVEGGDPDKVGAPTLVAADLGPMCIQNTVVRVRGRDDGADGRFLYWVMRAAFVAGKFERIATGTKLHHLGLNKLTQFSVPAPTSERQARVRQLDTAHETHLRLKELMRTGAEARRLVINQALEVGARGV